MKLLIIDPNISLGSPSLKGVVRSLPMLRAAGFEVEVWCWQVDDGLEIDRTDRLPQWGNIPLLRGFAFGWLSRLRSWWRFSVRKLRRPDVVFTVASYEPWCDVALVQFSPFDWERRQRILGIKSPRDFVERAVNHLALVSARRFLRKTTARRMLCVSEAVRDDLLEVQPSLDYRVLPNSYDPARFNAGVRHGRRATMRKRLGLQDGEVTFAFASAGHYRRKGFFLAVKAVSILRKKHPRVRFLVIGGKKRTLGRLHRKLDALHDGWREWIIFTGMVPDVENFFAASDAFLFPSYSEAFALVEAEADASGLPLFLTRHHGSEMILQDGMNGRFLEFDAPQMAEVLAEFVSGAWRPSAVAEPKKVLASNEYAAALLKIIQSVCPGTSDFSTQTLEDIVLRHSEASHS